MNAWKSVVFVGAALAAACDGYSSGPDDGDGSLTGGFYGTIEGFEKGNPFTRTVNFQMSEYLGTVTGGFSIVGGRGAGTVSGTVTGSTVSFTFDQTAPCPGTFAGTATLAGDRLTGTYSGSSCRGAVTASFEVNRTPEAVPL
ncbi:MAG TPA: hypothetical protein VEY33_12515 [Gemmatimonadota bacterium]|nr:hypothetical protein [Gemmatimonadota bacterium]